jgi:hypothetical protein
VQGGRGRDDSDLGRLANADPDDDERQVGERREQAQELDDRIGDTLADAAGADGNAGGNADQDGGDERAENAGEARADMLGERRIDEAGHDEIVGGDDDLPRRGQEDGRDQRIGRGKPPQPDDRGDGDRRNDRDAWPVSISCGKASMSVESVMPQAPLRRWRG